MDVEENSSTPATPPPPPPMCGDIRDATAYDRPDVKAFWERADGPWSWKKLNTADLRYLIEAWEGQYQRACWEITWLLRDNPTASERELQSIRSRDCGETSAKILVLAMKARGINPVFLEEADKQVNRYFWPAMKHVISLARQGGSPWPMTLVKFFKGTSDAGRIADTEAVNAFTLGMKAIDRMRTMLANEEAIELESPIITSWKATLKKSVDEAKSRGAQKVSRESLDAKIKIWKKKHGGKPSFTVDSAGEITLHAADALDIREGHGNEAPNSGDWTPPLQMKDIATILGCSKNMRSVAPLLGAMKGEIEKLTHQNYRVRFDRMIPSDQKRFVNAKKK